MFDIAIFVTATVATGILMTWRMSKIPGMALLESNIGQRRPDDGAYIRLSGSRLEVLKPSPAQHTGSRS